MKCFSDSGPTRVTETNERFSFVNLRLTHRNDQMGWLRGNGTRVHISWPSRDVFSLQEKWRMGYSRMEREYFDVKSTAHPNHLYIYSEL